MGVAEEEDAEADAAEALQRAHRDEKGQSVDGEKGAANHTEEGDDQGGKEGSTVFGMDLAKVGWDKTVVAHRI